MNNNYIDFIKNEINKSLILTLYEIKNDKYAGNYQVYDIKKINRDDVNIEYGNINDIEEFLTLGIVRFKDESNDIIDIPLRNLYILYENDSDNFNNDKKFIDLSKLDAFTIEDNKMITKGYGVVSFKVDIPSKENIDGNFSRILEIASKYLEMDMNDKFNAIKEVNDIINLIC